MVLDTFLINTQQYKVRIEGKVEQFRETISALQYTSVWFGLFGFMAYQPLLVIYRQIHFYVNNMFYWKQFSLE